MSKKVSGFPFCKMVPIPVIALFLMMALLPHSGWSQKRQLNASDTVKKIAYIDHSQLRKEYKAFGKALIEMSNTNAVKKKLHETFLKDLETATAKRLKADSIKGGKDRELIKERAANERTTKVNAYQTDLKMRHDERSKLIREYEQKIALAIDAVVTEGGFTEVKPLEKEPFKIRGKNVTDLILKKLN